VLDEGLEADEGFTFGSAPNRLLLLQNLYLLLPKPPHDLLSFLAAPEEDSEDFLHLFHFENVLLRFDIHGLLRVYFRQELQYLSFRPSVKRHSLGERCSHAQCVSHLIL
jgi:hypothetical protein